MKENIVQTIQLENNHELVIHDLSRKIGEDAWVVTMGARIRIPIVRDLFQTKAMTDPELDHILEILGDHVVYEYRVDRNMILDQDKEKIFLSLVAAFLKNTGPYVATPRFPEKLVLKEYRERIEKQKRQQRR